VGKALAVCDWREGNRGQERSEERKEMEKERKGKERKGKRGTRLARTIWKASWNQSPPFFPPNSFFSSFATSPPLQVLSVDEWVNE
jgi:hypothetical protein